MGLSLWRHGATRMALLLVALTLSLAALGSSHADGPDEDGGKGHTSNGKVVAVAKHDSRVASAHMSQGFSIASIDFYLDAIATMNYGGSYSDVYLSSSWDTTCGFFACGNTIQYEYTRTVWYGTNPYNAYSMQLNNRWVQSGLGVSGASCTISYPLASSCTVSGFTSKTVTKTGPTWYDLWSVYNEFGTGLVQFSNFTALGSLSETATTMICYYAGQCQSFQASDSGSI